MIKRNNILDIAKCWAIISVLVYHVVRTIVHCEFLSSFIDTYFLTLFFFISGLLVKDSKMSVEWYNKQVLHLLVPFIACWALYRVFLTLFEIPFISKGALDDAKGGYWFIFVLFLFNVFIKRLKIMSDKFKNITVKFIVMSLPFFCAVLLCSILPYDVAGYFSLMSIRRYWLFFVYGYAITNLWKCNSILESNRIGWSSIVIYALLSIYYVVFIGDIESNFDFAVWFLTNVSGIHAWLFLFKKLQNLLDCKVILKIGYNTLGIYVFHYFPLFILTKLIGGEINNQNSGMILPLSVFFFTLVLLVSSYAMTLLIKRVRPVAKIFLGIK